MHGLFAWRNGADLLWLGLLGIMLLVLWRNKRQFQQKTRSWLTTAGQVSFFEWSSHGHLPWPKIQYTYEVDEVEYQGNTIYLSTARHNLNASYARQLAYRVALAYEQDEPIPVYYDPALPEQSALDISLPKKLNIFMVFIGFLLVLHLTVMVLRWW